MIFQVAHPDGKQERLVMAWTLRYFFRYEVEHLLARCGFQLEAVYGNFDSSPLGDASPEMIFVAKVAQMEGRPIEHPIRENPTNEHESGTSGPIHH